MSEESNVLAGKRILIVEDEPLIAMDHSSVLSAAGAEIVATCPSVTRALDCLKRTEVDVAVVDYLLADRNSERYTNLKGVTKEIDEIRAEVRAIQEHLGIERKIAA